MQPLSENELDEMVIREKDRGAPPLTDWESLSGRLRAEGLIRQGGDRRLGAMPWMKIAAAITLAVGGAAVGRASAGAPLIPATAAQATPAAATESNSATGEANATLASGP